MRPRSIRSPVSPPRPAALGSKRSGPTFERGAAPSADLAPRSPGKGGALRRTQAVVGLVLLCGTEASPGADSLTLLDAERGATMDLLPHHRSDEQPLLGVAPAQSPQGAREGWNPGQ